MQKTGTDWDKTNGFSSRLLNGEKPAIFLTLFFFYFKIFFFFGLQHVVRHDLNISGMRQEDGIDGRLGGRILRTDMDAAAGQGL